MKINKKIYLNSPVNKSIFEFSRSVDMGEIEAFLLTMIKTAKDLGDYRSLSEILEQDFDFNKPLVHFYMTKVMDHFKNTKAITLMDESIDMLEVLPAEIEINKSVEKSIVENTFKTPEVKRRKKTALFAMSPITKVLSEFKDTKSNEANWDLDCLTISKLKLDGVKERWIESINGEIFVGESFSENSTKVIGYDTSIELSFKTNSIIIKDDLKDFLENNNIEKEYLQYATKSENGGKIENKFDFIDSEELLKKVTRKEIKNISVIDDEVYELAFKEFKPTNFKDVTLILPSYRKTSVSNFIKKLPDIELQKFSNVWKKSKDVLNEILTNREINRFNYDFISDKISKEIHRDILNKNKNLIDNRNINIFMDQNLKFKDIIGIIEENKLNISLINFKKYSEEVWKDIKKMSKLSKLDREYESYLKASKDIENLKVDVKNIDKAKELKISYETSTSVFRKAFGINVSPMNESFSRDYEAFIILEKTELKKEAKSIAGVIRENFEKILKKYKMKEQGWVASNLSKLEGPTKNEIKNSWSLANKFNHYIEDVTKEDVHKLNNAKLISEKIKLKKEEKNVS